MCGSIWRSLALGTAVLVSILGLSCGGGSPAREAASPTGPSSTQTAPEPTSTPTPVVLDSSLYDALAAYASGQGWELVGDCPHAREPQDVGKYCFFAPEQSDGHVSIVVGVTFSGHTYTLTLERGADGSYEVIDVQETRG